VHAEPAALGDAKAGARAPRKAGPAVVRFLPVCWSDRFHVRGEFDGGQPAKLLGQHLRLEAPLALQRYVAEFGAADRRAPVCPGACGIGGPPEVRYPVRRGIEDFHNVRAPELGLLFGVGKPDPHPLPRDAVADEDDAALMAGNAVSAVGDGADVDHQFESGGSGLGVRAH
jgi:hypothetical protein